MRWRRPDSVARASRALAAPLAAAGGLGLLAWLIQHVGWGSVWAQLRVLGPLAPVVLALTGLRYGLQAAGWRLALPPGGRPAWGPAVRGIVAGEAVGYLAWGGFVAREPVKVWFVRHQTDAARALTATIAERTMYGLAAALLAAIAGVVAARTWHGGLLLAVVAVGAAAVAGLGARRRSRMSGVARPRATCATLPDDGPAKAAAPAFATSVAETARALWRDRRGGLMAIFTLAVLQEALLVAEAWLLLHALGADVSFDTVVVVEGGTKVINAVGGFVPGRVGVAEGALAALADALRLGAGLGVSLALARRARAVTWSLAGLAILGGHAVAHARRRRGPGHPVAAPLSASDLVGAWRSARS